MEKSDILKEKNESYSKPLALTSQFRFCGNPFRLDFYKFCSFGCKYCFARNINGNNDFDMNYAKFEIVKNQFEKAFENDKPTKNINIELLRRRTPIHCGGLADPFQPIEFELKLNYKLIELSNKYQIPLIFSTKACYLPDEYYKILDPKLHAFQISLIGVDDEFVKKYESNTPSPLERINFLKTLRSKGFWCSIRLQPMIDLEQGIKLAKMVDGIANYLTIEHLKIPTDNKVIKEMFKDNINKYKRGNIMRHLELPKIEKIDNINKIMECCKKTIVGVGDNDLHFLSQSRCCCGIDTIGGGFDNYLKYNLTYFSTYNIVENNKENLEELYIPKCSVRNCVNGDIRVKNVNDLKSYVEMYCSKNNEYMGENSPNRSQFKGIKYSKKSGVKTQQMSLFD